ERELDRHVARHVAHRQLAGGAELVAALGSEAVRDVVRGGVLFHRKEVVAQQRAVAIVVASFGRCGLDLDVETAAREVLRVELDVRGEALEDAGELRALLNPDESQFAFLRLYGPLGGGERDAAADQNQDEEIAKLLVNAHG